MKRSLAIVALLFSGCTSVVTAGEDPVATTGTSGSTGPVALDTTGGSTADPSQGSTAATDPASASTTAAWETDGADDGYGTTGSCGFTCPPPGPGGFSCNFTDQDCQEGEKCAPWANDGGSLWNALRCVPVDAEPSAHGDPCTVEGSFVSGIDTCELGVVCTASSADSRRTNVGTCTALCNAGPCPDGTLCTVPTPLGVGVCGEVCDPLAEDACVVGQACLPAGFGFACHSALYGGQDGPCADTLAGCGPGYVCTDASQCDDEFSDTCCAQLCDLETPHCPGGQTCSDYGSPLSAYATVGFCEG